MWAMMCGDRDRELRNSKPNECFRMSSMQSSPMLLLTIVWMSLFVYVLLE